MKSADSQIDTLIVGSGLSAIGAALGILKVRANAKLTIVDVGTEPPFGHGVDQNLYDYREHNDSFALLLGEKFERLRALSRTSSYRPARLTTPGFQFVADGSERLLPLHETATAMVQSLAQGGLANAWGAGVYRYTSRDLQDFPLRPNELETFYDQLTDEIGISGMADDLIDDFGSTYGLQPPLELSQNAQLILAKYEKRKAMFQKQGLRMGRPRYAILSREKNGRRSLQYQNLEFWQPHLPEIYSPAYTLKRLIAEGKVRYVSGHLAEHFRANGFSVDLFARNLRSGETVEFSARRLVLAAGALGSARLVLNTYRDEKAVLPLLDNPAVQIPLVFPSRIGAALEKRSLGSAHLSLIYDQGWPGPLQGGLLELSSPARAEFFEKFPLSAQANLALVRLLLPAMMVNLVFFPSDVRGPAQLKWRFSEGQGQLQISAEGANLSQKIIGRLVSSSRLFGGFSHESLVVRVPFGGGIHYAGSLPMKENPDARLGRYQCNRFGELRDAPGVVVADGALFPRLPAKNHSFTLMANAMRIGENVGRNLERDEEKS